MNRNKIKQRSKKQKPSSLHIRWRNSPPPPDIPSTQHYGALGKLTKLCVHSKLVFILNWENELRNWIEEVNNWIFEKWISSSFRHQHFNDVQTPPPTGYIKGSGIPLNDIDNNGVRFWYYLNELGTDGWHSLREKPIFEPSRFDRPKPPL